MRRKLSISMLFLVLLATQAKAEVVVIMRQEAQTAGKYIRVCDIARVDGPKDQVREVSMTVLGPAPASGEVKNITRWDIESRLYEMGIGASVSFSGNDTVRVRGDGAASGMASGGGSFRELNPVPARAFGGGFELELDGRSRETERKAPAKPAPYAFEREKPQRPMRVDERLDADARKRVALEISNYFADRYREKSGKRQDIEVTAKLLSANGDIPYSAYEVKVDGAEGRIPGKTGVTLLVRDTEDAKPREVEVAAETEVYGKALVAARKISRGETLGKNDVAVARVRMESGNSYLPPNPKAVIGRESGRALKAGEAILAQDAPMGDAVKRGSTVMVKTSGRGWTVETTAKALGSGAVDDVITVEDVGNKTKYQARIIAPGVVSAMVKYNHGVVKRLDEK